MRAAALMKGPAKHRITTDVALRDIGLRVLRLVSDLLPSLQEGILTVAGAVLALL